MEGLGKDLYDLICEKYRSVPKFAESIGIPPQTIYSMCSNGVTGSTFSTVIPIASALGIDSAALSQGAIIPVESQDKNYFDAPVVEFHSLNKERVSYECFPIPGAIHERYPRAFLTRIPDNSLDRIIPDGCYALMDPCQSIDLPDQPYVISFNDDIVEVKRVRPLANGLELSPDSNDPTYPKRIVNYSEYNRDDINVIGRIVWYAIPLDWEVPS